ncbi:hypothetical protein K435DRAFT_865409 [Dendrothele bispora CBS 962.96]|uniref:Uncharacterized protein n=1 Tax=Dendrothele bispora (strain CBS 962.96) TaxID=1314807 RepID=A0A4S8LJH6_DENBC|nr:hypothetical protein K435DRAFT_865409 [Dendrothele bispora CBS 962.96]
MTSEANNFEWSHQFQSPGFDTRRFLKDKISITAGYLVEPAFDDAVDFSIPNTGHYEGRILNFGDYYEDPDEGKRIELYSRNSNQLPYFPGASRIRFPNTPYPYLDGSLGRFDYLKNPQLYDSSKPYLCFIGRTESGQYYSRAPENVPVFLVWKSAPEPQNSFGEVNHNYWMALNRRIRTLLKNATALLPRPECASWLNFRESFPSCPSDCDWENVPPNLYFDEFVRKLTRIQYWVRELAAWTSMAELLQKHPLNSNIGMKEVTDHEADEDLIGVWINGMKENQAAWLWQRKVPIFVAHIIRGRKDLPSTVKKTSDPLEFTPLLNNSLHEAWMRLARKSAILCCKDYFDEGCRSQEEFSDRPLSNWQSSSLATEDNFPGLELDVMMQPNEELDLREKFGPKEVTMEKLDPERISRIVPPPVHKLPAGRQWQKFVEDEDNENRTCMHLIGRRSSTEDHDYVYYDRHNGRELYMRGRIILPENVVHDTSVFGLPAPPLRYWSSNQFNQRIKASDWVYTQREPITTDLGRVAPYPDLSLLPLLRLEPDNSPLEITAEDNTPPLVIPQLRIPSPIQHKDSTQMDVDEHQPSCTIDETEIPYWQPNNSNPFRENWEIDVLNKNTPPSAPTPLLRFKGIEDIELDDFRAFLYYIVPRIPSPVQVIVSRIVKAENGEFWVKIFDNDQAGWIIRAFHRFVTDDGYQFRLSLVSLEEWRDSLDATADREWSLPYPLNPNTELIENVCPLPGRIRPPLGERLSEHLTTTLTKPSATLADRLGMEPLKEPTTKKRKHRGGKRKREYARTLGPLPSANPSNWQDWEPTSWLQTKIMQ